MKYQVHAVATRIGLLALACLGTGFTGCGLGGPTTVPVSGIVILDGQPMPGAIVTFVPHGETTGYGGQGQTDDQGKFVARMQDGKTAAGKPGLMPGEYRVLVNKLVRPDGTVFIATDEEAPIDSNARETVLPQYSDYQRTTLSATIGSGNETLKFELKSRRS